MNIIQLSPRLIHAVKENSNSTGTLRNGIAQDNSSSLSEPELSAMSKVFLQADKKSEKKPLAAW
ncbi:hypothetical protein WMW72_00045 [Paenibacillus filicis]|uniref:Uncharacterized protein n=1 Tax=Paenibacillus filicis TaxID=669464 RepID=A0ABU9DBR0_9BACL